MQSTDHFDEHQYFLRTFHEKDGARSGCREGIACGGWTLSTAHGISRDEIKSREQDRVRTPLEAVGRTSPKPTFPFSGASLGWIGAFRCPAMRPCTRFPSTRWRSSGRPPGISAGWSPRRKASAYWSTETKCRGRSFPGRAVELRREPATPPRRHTGDPVRAEDQIERKITWNELYDETSRMAQALRALGVEAGDRIAGFVLVKPSLRCWPPAHWRDLDLVFGGFRRARRARPLRTGKTKVLFTADGYHYNGKPQDSLEDRSCPGRSRASVTVYSAAERRAGNQHGSNSATASSRLHTTLRISTSRNCRSTTSSTFCIPRARPARRNVSCTVPAAPCCI